MPAAHQQDWLTNYRDAAGERIDLSNASTVCDEVLAAVDPECGFEASQMRGFSEEVAANGGDFSISFWYRPFDEKSLLGGRFLPHIAFYSSLFPPEHSMVLGSFKANPGPFFPSCRAVSASRFLSCALPPLPSLVLCACTTPSIPLFTAASCAPRP